MYREQYGEYACNEIEVEIEDPCTIEALFKKTSCLHTEQHKHGGLTITSPLTCALTSLRL